MANFVYACKKISGARCRMRKSLCGVGTILCTPGDAALVEHVFGKSRKFWPTIDLCRKTRLPGVYTAVLARAEAPLSMGDGDPDAGRGRGFFVLPRTVGSFRVFSCILRWRK